MTTVHRKQAFITTEPSFLDNHNAFDHQPSEGVDMLVATPRTLFCF